MLITLKYRHKNALYDTIFNVKKMWMLCAENVDKSALFSTSVKNRTIHKPMCKSKC